MEIYLVRHTKVDVPSNTCYGQSDVKLLSSFEEDSNLILKKIPDYKNCICYASPLTRCKALAEKISTNEIITDIRLMELNFGDWELKDWNTIEKIEFDKWHSDFVNNPVPNGESYFELYTRAISFWKEITLKKENAIIITHAGVIRALLSHILGLPLANSFRLAVDYGGVTKIILNQDFVTLDYLNR